MKVITLSIILGLFFFTTATSLAQSCPNKTNKCGKSTEITETSSEIEVTTAEISTTIEAESSPQKAPEESNNSSGNSYQPRIVGILKKNGKVKRFKDSPQKRKREWRLMEKKSKKGWVTVCPKFNK